MNGMFWRSVWYDGYEGIETPLTWRNLDYLVVGGHLLWAEVPYPPFLVQLAYDAFGVFVGDRFYPQKVKRRPKDLVPHPDVPPPVYLPQPSVPPIERNPEIPNPWFPKKPKPVGPIIDFCNGALKGNDVYAARERCENGFKTGEGSEWLEQCMEHDSRCSASMDPYKCCLWKCMTAAGAGPGEAAEAVECFLKGYGGVWRGL